MFPSRDSRERESPRGPKRFSLSRRLVNSTDSCRRRRGRIERATSRSDLRNEDFGISFYRSEILQREDGEGGGAGGGTISFGFSEPFSNGSDVYTLAGDARGFSIRTTAGRNVRLIGPGRKERPQQTSGTRECRTGVAASRVATRRESVDRSVGLVRKGSLRFSHAFPSRAAPVREKERTLPSGGMEAR